MALSKIRLELLHRIAETREQDSQYLLAEAQRKLADQQSTQRELQSYLVEYERQPLRSATPALLENRRQFLLRLQTALAAQEQAARNAALRVEEARSHWMDQRRELQIAETMLERGFEVERRAEARTSQNETDEFARMRRHHSAHVV